MTPLTAALAAAASLGFVHGPAPVNDLGPASSDVVTDGKRYVAFATPSDRISVYDKTTGKKIVVRSKCDHASRVNRNGRFLFSCEDSEKAEVVSAATGKIRRLKAVGADSDTFWRGAGSRFAIYQSPTACDSAGCSYTKHIVDLRTGADLARSESDYDCLVDLDEPRADGVPCTDPKSHRFSLDLDQPREGYVTLNERGREVRAVRVCSGPCFDDDIRLDNGWVAWTEPKAGGASVIHAENISGSKKRIWRVDSGKVSTPLFVGSRLAVKIRDRAVLLSYPR